MKKYLILIAILLYSYSNTSAQPVFIADSLNNYINRAMQNWQIPGAAVLIVKDGKIVFEKEFGVKELGKPDKVDENTLFMIGSNTKAFTGTALAMLIEEGKCNLNDKVIKYLPDFKMKDPWVNNDLNLADIVSHRMGLATFQGDFMYWASDLTRDEVLEKFGMLTPAYDFRTKYGYTNAGYAIAGKIIEKISGKSWAEYLKENLFIPLKMNRTVALSQEFKDRENIAKPHTLVDNKITPIPFKNIDNLAPCGSIGSSIEDMSHWVIAQLDSGNFENKNVIPFKAIQDTRQLLSIERRARHPYNENHYTLYGMGWEFQDYDGKEIISHTGGVDGFVTSVTLLPEKQLGIVILTNTDKNAFFTSLKWEILDAYLGLPYRNYDSTYFAAYSIRKAKNDNELKALRDSVALNIKPTLELSAFEGKYINDPYGMAELKVKGNTLELSLEHHSKIKGELQYIGNNRFLCTYSDPTYGIRVFPFDIENGEIKSFTLFVDNFIDYFPYKFVKE